MEEDLYKQFHDLRQRLRGFQKELDTVYNKVVGKTGNNVEGELAGRVSVGSGSGSEFDSPSRLPNKTKKLKKMHTSRKRLTT